MYETYILMSYNNLVVKGFLAEVIKCLVWPSQVFDFQKMWTEFTEPFSNVEMVHVWNVGFDEFTTLVLKSFSYGVI